MVHQFVPNEHGADRASDWQLQVRELLPKLLPNLGRAPARILPVIFLAQCLGGRAEPIGDDFAGSSIAVPAGADVIPGLSEA
jgi:hypothetical protein